GVVLVAASGLMTRSFMRVIDVRPGFTSEHVITSRVLLPFARYGGVTPPLNFFYAVAPPARAVSRGRDVGLTDWVPLSGERHDLAIDVDDDRARSNAGGADHPAASVDDSYFETLGIPLLRGRTFRAPDDQHPSDEVVVSAAFAEHYWP